MSCERLYNLTACWKWMLVFFNGIIFPSIHKLQLLKKRLTTFRSKMRNLCSRQCIRIHWRWLLWWVVSSCSLENKGGGVCWCGCFPSWTHRCIYININIPGKYKCSSNSIRKIFPSIPIWGSLEESLGFGNN